jgi:hypothetical protein
MKVCITNGENRNFHKLQYFLNSLKGRIVNWYGKYETVYPTMIWAEVQRAFIIRFSEIRSERASNCCFMICKTKEV